MRGGLQTNNKILPVALFLLAGTICTFGILYLTVAYKLQSYVSVMEGADDDLITKDFYHPFMQTWTMFVG